MVQGTTWGVRGQTPVIRVPGQRQSVSVASAVNARGGFWFATYKGGMNSGLFIEMLKVLMHRRRKPLMLILDSLPAHKGKAVKSYVESTNRKLELHYPAGLCARTKSRRIGVELHEENRHSQDSSRRETPCMIASTNSCSKSDGTPPWSGSFFKAEDASYISD